ncbi:MAG: transglutaminase-like domain-containing protein [Candidatus Thermoplasmatota archaeon]|nr:transglutaminase-like domain-containing protein [Candidatus Thermoplasmatota archaeon]
MKYKRYVAIIVALHFFLLLGFPIANDFVFQQKEVCINGENTCNAVGATSFIPFFRWGARDTVIEYKEEIVNNRNTSINITTYLAVPPSLANQEIKKIEYNPEPNEFKRDRWGQKVACYSYTIHPKETIVLSWTAEAEIFNIRYILLSSLVKGDIPEDVFYAYTADDEKYKIYHPLIQSIVDEVAANETNILIKAIKLHDYVIDHLDYALAGGWDDAPTILERGNGSCSEYCFAYIALCRAAGIPARYKGGTYLGERVPHVDDIFHRMVQIYMPGYGWIPVDMTFDEWIFHHYGFGAHTNKFFALMVGGGSSEFLSWTYNSHHVFPSGANISTNSSATWHQWERVKKIRQSYGKV